MSHGSLFHILIPFMKKELRPLSSLSKGALKSEAILVSWSCIWEFCINLVLKFE